MTTTPMINNNFKTLSEIFNDILSLRGINIERLSELTNIPKNYLIALQDGDFKNLPSSPYVRGYLMRIAKILEVDGNLLWQTYKKENLFKTSGSEDKLPSNRFAIRPFNKKKLIIGLIMSFIAISAVWKINFFFGLLGNSRLEIINPAVDGLITDSPFIKLRGKTNPRDKLTINNEETVVEKDGLFEKEFSLQPGINTIEFKTKRLLGKEKEVVRQVVYQPR